MSSVEHLFHNKWKTCISKHLFIYWRVRAIERATQSKSSSTCCFMPKMTATAMLSQAQARSRRILPLSLTCRVGYKYSGLYQRAVLKWSSWDIRQDHWGCWHCTAYLYPLLPSAGPEKSFQVHVFMFLFFNAAYKVFLLKHYFMTRFNRHWFFQ